MEKEIAASFIGGPLDGMREKSGRGEFEDHDYQMAFARSMFIHIYRRTGSNWKYDGIRRKPRMDEYTWDIESNE